jgi:DNA-directed RNA polymerase subunit omega
LAGQGITLARRSLENDRIMNYQALDEANKVIENKQTLINVVSRRVRQLSSGIRPLVEVRPSMTFADIAIAEILQGKVKAEFRVAFDA